MVQDKQIGVAHLSRAADLFPICGFPSGRKLSGIWQVDIVGPVECERCIEIQKARPELPRMFPEIRSAR